MLASVGSPPMYQNVANAFGEFRNARITDVTIRGGAYELANISNVRRNQGKVARHGLLDNVWRALLIGRKNQGVTCAHVQCETLLRVFTNHEELNGRVFIGQMLGLGLGLRKPINSNFSMC